MSNGIVCLGKRASNATVNITLGIKVTTRCLGKHIICTRFLRDLCGCTSRCILSIDISKMHREAQPERCSSNCHRVLGTLIVIIWLLNLSKHLRVKGNLRSLAIFTIVIFYAIYKYFKYIKKKNFVLCEKHHSNCNIFLLP